MSPFRSTVLSILILLLSCPAGNTKTKGAVETPTNLAQCLVKLKQTLPPETLNLLTSSQESVVFDLNLNVGTWIRNNWLRNQDDSPLKKSFANLGITSPDDISSIILTSLWRDLHKQPLKVSEQVKKIKDYWFFAAPQVTQKRTLSPLLWNSPLILSTGKSTKLESWKGKVFVILIAFRDHHSVSAVQALNILKAQYERRGLQVITLFNAKLTPKTVVTKEWKDAFIASTNPSMPLVLEPTEQFLSEINKSLIYPGSMALPQTILVGANGFMITRFNDWDASFTEKSLRSEVQKSLPLIQVKKSAQQLSD